jgi:hypothetical protein
MLTPVIIIIFVLFSHDVSSRFVVEGTEDMGSAARARGSKSVL